MITDQIREVRERVLGFLKSSSLRPLAERLYPCMANGKMLRARLLLRVGAVTDVPLEDRFCAATAAELVHAASLLHDDVIDEGKVRRGRPTLWVQEGVKGAVLLGDLMVCHAFALVQQSPNASLAGMLVESAREMCDAETQQELLLKGRAADWETCISVARRKTGALFAFAAYAGAGPTAPLRVALRAAGYAVGTAYQLADDVFDAQGDPLRSDKTLGGDAANAMPTAASAAATDGVDPKLYVWDLCDSARASLSQWPDVQDAWDAYMTHDMKPALEGFLEPARTEALS
jgi:geranylgeranyl pyrophosphate synthase